MGICPGGSFADDYNRRCMDVCLNLRYAFSNLTHNVCVDKCLETGYYASDKTKSCVPLCP